MNIHNFAPTILRTYDIRGIYQDTLTEADAYAIGKAFIACLRDRGHGGTVAVGRDGRLSSPSLAAALIDGLVKAGDDNLPSRPTATVTPCPRARRQAIKVMPIA